MPDRELVISGTAADRRAALCVGGTLLRVAVDDDERLPRAGDVILGRVRKVNADLGAAFVDIGDDRDGLLMRADWHGGANAGGPAVIEGAALVVRVLRARTSGKGAKLRSVVPPPQMASSLQPPAILSRAPSPVDSLLATALATGVDAVICDDRDTATALRRVAGLADRVTLLPAAGSAFRATGVDAELEAALAPVIALPSGGRVTIAETPALIAIDVDTGGAHGGGAPRTTLMVNAEAATAIGVAIRLRDLAGTIVIDFVPMTRADHRAKITASLRSAIGADDRQVHVAGFTRLGLFELRRQRCGPSLGEILLDRCPVCDGSGRIAAPAETARRAIAALADGIRGRATGTPRIIAAPPVAKALRTRSRARLLAAAAALGREIEIVEDAALPPDGFRLDDGAGGGGRAP
ncbi:MAG: ribonuclease E/G [Rhodospirillales bacterium]|jgi:Ribonuclease G/E|nr:ribonuclease E/G [Rhodospirillales bacterium]